MTEREALLAVAAAMEGAAAQLDPCPLREDLRRLARLFLADASGLPSPQPPVGEHRSAPRRSKPDLSLVGA